MTLDWRDVWKAVEREISDRGWTLEQLYAATGISDTTFLKMREGRPLRRRDKIAALIRGLDWMPDALERIERGDHPGSTEFYDLGFIAGRQEAAIESLRSLSVETAQAIAALRQEMRRLQLQVEELVESTTQHVRETGERLGRLELWRGEEGGGPPAGT